MRNNKMLLGLSGLLVLMLNIGATRAETAGLAQFVYGSVKLTPAKGVAHPLQKGELISEGDTINTARNASAQIRMKDGGFIAVRPDTQLKFDSFKYTGQVGQPEKSNFSLLKGGFRAVTGMIGRVNKQDYRITTPAATLGIRGTDHETFYLPANVPGALAGAYSKVNIGETTLTTNKGTINVMPNQMGFAGGLNQLPQIQPINTGIFTVSAAPTKTIKESKQENDKQAASDDKKEKAGNKTEQQSSAKGGAKESDETGDVRTTSAVDNSKSVTGSGAGGSTITAPSLIVALTTPLLPIEASNGSQSFNASSQTLTSGGSAVAFIPSVAYLANHVAVEGFGIFGTSGGSGNMATQADLKYVPGTTDLTSFTFREFGGGSAYVATSTISGGTATSANAAAGIQYGAWTGYTGQTNNWTTLLGGQQRGNVSGSWMYGAQGYLDAANLTAGSPFVGGTAAFTYQMDGANAPQSRNSGLTGTVTSASFTVNFSSMLLNGNLAILMPGNDVWGASLVNQIISLGNPVGTSSIFFSGASPGVGGSTLTVTHGVATTCVTCGGNMSGTFTGQNFAGALLSYNLYDNALGGGDVAGNIAFTRNFTGNTMNPVVTLGTAAPTGNIVVATNSNGGGANISLYPVASTTTTGNLLTAYGSSGGVAPNTFTQSTTITCPTCTSTASGQVATSGIYYGNWTAGSISQSYSQTTAASSMPSYWITGPEAGPLYLPQALTGTATFTFNAGQVSNSMGVAGTILGTTALALDFNRQTVGINLDVSIADTTQTVHAWNAKTVQGQEAALGNGQGIGGAGFYASTFNNGGGSGLLTLTVDGSPANVTSASGYINGQLTGSGLTGAIMSFNLSGSLSALNAGIFETINGVAAFTGTASNISTPYRYVSIAFYDPFAAIPRPLLGFYANADSPSTPSVGAKMDVNGNLTQFDNQFINNNGGNDSKTFVSNTSTLMDHGSDPVSGISWGRWAGGTFNVTNRVTGVVTPVTQAGSLHWITEPVATSAVTLPTTGTYTYINAGGTLPTDNLGNVGTLNSATLAANFTSQTVNLGVNATVAGATLNATATNAPIIQQTVFYASSQEPAASTSYLTVACTGCAAGASTGGTVIGKFTGTGAIGAAMTYGLQNGASTISGVTAFHR